MQTGKLQEYFGEYGKACFGCGPENPHGIGLVTHQEGEEGVTRLEVPTHLQGWPGILQGGIIAVLMDCTVTSLAYAKVCQAAGLPPGHPDTPLFVTVNFNIDYLKPTPVGRAIELRARVEEMTERKLTASCTVTLDGQKTAEGRAIMVQVAGMPD